MRKPLIMGILNVTPDSFSDGGCFLNPEHACQQAMRLLDAGADILDLGGESSRPGALPISVDEELARVIPVIERLRTLTDACISIDTTKAQVMLHAVQAGACFINDIKALRAPEALAVAAQLDVPVCLMHMQGEPAFMQDHLDESMDIIEVINQFFKERITACLKAGMARERLILDPGFGFGKSVKQNLLIMKRLHYFHHHALPLLIGVSRKSTLGAVLKNANTSRLYAGLSAAVFAASQGVGLIRTHDVSETKQAMMMFNAIQEVS